MTMTIPPIVGVPDFFICDSGPSSRILCPNFNRLKKGIKTGDNRTVIKKLIAIVVITIYKLIHLSPFLSIPSTNVKYYIDNKDKFLLYNDILLIYTNFSINVSKANPRDALNKITVCSFK